MASWSKYIVKGGSPSAQLIGHFVAVVPKLLVHSEHIGLVTRELFMTVILFSHGGVLEGLLDYSGPLLPRTLYHFLLKISNLKVGYSSECSSVGTSVDSMSWYLHCASQEEELVLRRCLGGCLPVVVEEELVGLVRREWAVVVAVNWQHRAPVPLFGA